MQITYKERGYKFIPVSEKTHQSLLREKHKRSIEKSKTVTFDQLIRELLNLKPNS